MNHDLEFVQRTDRGYLARCACGVEWSHGNSDAVRLKHKNHADGMAGTAWLREELARIEKGKATGD